MSVCGDSTLTWHHSELTMMLKLVDCMSMCNCSRRPDVVDTCATARHDRSRNTAVFRVGANIVVKI